MLPPSVTTAADTGAIATLSRPLAKPDSVSQTGDRVMQTSRWIEAWLYADDVERRPVSCGTAGEGIWTVEAGCSVQDPLGTHAVARVRRLAKSSIVTSDTNSSRSLGLLLLCYFTVLAVLARKPR